LFKKYKFRGSSAAYVNSTDATFIEDLQGFLSTPSGNLFINDVVIDTTSNQITASRLHILTSSITSSGDQADMMNGINIAVTKITKQTEILRVCSVCGTICAYCSRNTNSGAYAKTLRGDEATISRILTIISA
jgi:hypothetical protein